MTFCFKMSILCGTKIRSIIFTIKRVKLVISMFTFRMMVRIHFGTLLSVQILDFIMFEITIARGKVCVCIPFHSSFSSQRSYTFKAMHYSLTKVVPSSLQRYLFTSLLYSQDIIRRTESHQQALIALLNEHSSLFGLRVKVLNRDDSDFPGGWHYHHSRMSPTVRNLVTGKIKPYIFHMSWTNNKMNKIKFFQQMGDWFVNDSCIAKKTDEVERLLDEGCCLPEALVRCHFKDKPSIVPCKGSPSIDEGKPSWWQ